jgi:hypothetical protein
VPARAISADLQTVLAGAWALLERGVRERARGPAPIITVATAGEDGAPRLRSVVLREASAAACSLSFFTDVQSRKIGELTRDPRLAAHVWDPAEQTQLRVTGRALVHARDALARAAWADLRPESRQAYGVVPAPGSIIPGHDRYEIPEDEGARFERFGVVVVAIETMEALRLTPDGHRRALFTFGAEPAGIWLAP